MPLMVNRGWRVVVVSARSEPRVCEFATQLAFGAGTRIHDFGVCGRYGRSQTRPQAYERNQTADPPTTGNGFVLADAFYILRSRPSASLVSPARPQYSGDPFTLTFLPGSFILQGVLLTAASRGYSL